MTGYKVFRAGSQVGASALTTYADTGLTAPTTYPSAPGPWVHVLGSVEISHTQGSKLMTVWIDDVQGTNVVELVAHGSLADTGPSSIPVINGQPFYIGNDATSNYFTGDIADLWIAPGVSLLDGNGDIATSTRRKFISADGKPVDLGSDCSNPTGTAPAVCLSGDASTFGTNQGTRGSFTTTGTLTDAATSPSN